MFVLLHHQDIVHFHLSVHGYMLRFVTIKVSPREVKPLAAIFK